MAGKGGRGRSRTREPSRDKGTLQTRMRGARAFLSISDQVRLQMLVTKPAERLFAEGHVTLPKAKKMRTEAEEREALFRAVREECETLLAKAARAPHATERRDPIGRAWYEGLLEGHGVDSAVLRELGREYGWLYWRELTALGTAMAGYDERVGRPNVARKFHMVGLTGSDGARFEKLESVLSPLGHEPRRCLQKLCVDDIWFEDGPGWLDRCINSHRAARRGRGESGAPPGGRLSGDADKRTLELAILCLKTLALGVVR